MAEKFLPKVFAKLRLVIFRDIVRVKDNIPEKREEKRQGEIHKPGTPDGSRASNPGDVAKGPLDRIAGDREKTLAGDGFRGISSRDIGQKSPRYFSI